MAVGTDALFFRVAGCHRQGGWLVLPVASREQATRPYRFSRLIPTLPVFMPDDIPAPVLQFLADHIRSIAQLELLLMLHRERQRTWTIADAAKELYTAVSMTEPLLESLRAIGLVSLHGD